MSVLRRALGWLVALVPVPRSVEDAPGPVDPRVDPEALDSFGHAQITGWNQPHTGGVVVGRYGTQRAADARDELAPPPDEPG